MTGSTRSGYFFKNILNNTYKFKDQRRLSSRLGTVMFRGTPCRFIDEYGLQNGSNVKDKNGKWKYETFKNNWMIKMRREKIFVIF